MERLPNSGSEITPAELYLAPPWPLACFVCCLCTHTGSLMHHTMDSGKAQHSAVEFQKLDDGPSPAPPTSSNRAWLITSTVLAVAVVCLSVQNWLLVHNPRAGLMSGPIPWQGPFAKPPLPDIPISPDCLLPLGGGAAQKGGSFPHFVYSSCKLDLDVYLQQYGLYYAQVSHVAQAAIAYISQLKDIRPPTRDQVFVFDIDETVLSNAIEWAGTNTLPGADMSTRHMHSPHMHHSWWQSLLSRAGLLAPHPPRDHPPCHRHKMMQAHDPQLHDSTAEQRDASHGSQHDISSGHLLLTPTATSTINLPGPLRGVLEGERPPLVAVRELYLYLIAHNYSVAFITGRKEPARAFTAHNLATAGYGDQCAPGAQPSPAQPCYVALHLRDESDDRPASVYKPERRKALMTAGYTLIGNIGDQFSDLDGLHVAESSWKLPNSMYYIL